MKILIVSSVVPARGRGGGCLTLYRHFVERKDYTVAVCGHLLEQVDEVDTWICSHGRMLHRLARTRLKDSAANLRSLIHWQTLPSGLLDRAQAWRPDVIFNVPDHETSGWAWQLSRRLSVPLAVNFQDLFPLYAETTHGQKLHPMLRDYNLNKLRFLNQSAELVFYISEGMRNWFGGAANGHVLRPMGSNADHASGTINAPPQHRPLRLTYAGNCHGPYGRMMLRLAREALSHPGISLSIFTMGNDWPDRDVRQFKKAGILRGQLDFADLQHELRASDAFLTVMSFEPAWQAFNQTSFTSKWLDYAPLAKPVFVWAPENSTAVAFAKEHHCGDATTTDSAQDLIQSIFAAAGDAARWHRLSESSLMVSKTVLNPEHIHGVLKRELERLCP